MKKIYSLILMCLIAVSIASCSLPINIPEDGIWYCDELKISIDFSIIDRSAQCAKLYNEDGTYQTLECYIDHISIMDFYLDDGTKSYIYLSGAIKLKGDEFIVTADKSYIFLRQSE